MLSFRASNFTFSPLLSLVPGLMLLGVFSIDGKVSGVEAFWCALVVVAGGVWAGLKSARTLPGTLGGALDTTKVDTALASAILDALPDPVLLLDRRRQVLASNRAADTLLGDGIHGRDVCLILRHPDAQQAVNEALKGLMTAKGIEIFFDSPVRQAYQLQVMEIPKQASASVRAVLALHDLTTLKHAEDMRADFVANVSHELRSPLSALTGFIETLQTTAKDDVEAQARFLKIMAGETHRMTRLIRDLLSLSRIEVNEHIRPTGRVCIADIISTVAQSLELKAAEKGVTIETHVPESLSFVTGDGDELHQVIQNLVDNAVAYGASNTSVIVKVESLENFSDSKAAGVNISVENCGDGIREEHVLRLTERFYRTDKGRSRDMGGTGLGLAIVKHIVNHHRGRLIINSTLGKGSTFSVQLPTED